MKTGAGALLTLAGFFAVLSLFSIGGGNSAIPEMHRYAVDVQHWLTDRQFADTFALSQLTPGPNLIIVALIGFHVAGVLGAVVAMLAMCGKAWHGALSRGLVPVTIGLTAASATVIATSADYGSAARAVTAATAIICYFFRINPIWIFAAAALLGLAGVV